MGFQLVGGQELAQVLPGAACPWDYRQGRAFVRPCPQRTGSHTTPRNTSAVGRPTLTEGEAWNFY